MPLTPEQNATLQLLLVRGQSYADLAKVLRVEETEVRLRARAALTELGGRDPDTHVALTDYLLGQADPITRADVVRRLRDDPDHHALAAELAERLRETFPDAALPRLPGEARPRRPKGLKAPATGAPSFSRRQTRLFAALGASAVVVVVVVLAIAGVFSSDDEGTGATGQAAEQGSADDRQLERVRLRPQGRADASGEAVFGLTGSDQPFVDVTIRDLDPPSGDRTYVLWLLLNDGQGYPLSPVIVNENGAFDDRFPIPAAALSLVARIRFVDVSIAPTRKIQRIIGRAIEETSLVVDRPGETVLRGTVPRAEDGDGEGAEGAGAQE